MFFGYVFGVVVFVNFDCDWFVVEDLYDFIGFVGDVVVFVYMVIGWRNEIDGFVIFVVIGVDDVGFVVVDCVWEKSDCIGKERFECFVGMWYVGIGFVEGIGC